MIERVPFKKAHTSVVLFKKAHMCICQWIDRTSKRKGLDSVSTEMIQKFFRTCRDYEHAYREGLIGKAIEERVKVYKSHRRINSSNQ